MLLPGIPGHGEILWECELIGEDPCQLLDAHELDDDSNGFIDEDFDDDFDDEFEEELDSDEGFDEEFYEPDGEGLEFDVEELEEEAEDV